MELVQWCMTRSEKCKLKYELLRKIYNASLFKSPFPQNCKIYGAGVISSALSSIYSL